MVKFKKFLAAVTALSISASAIAGFAVSASADDVKGSISYADNKLTVTYTAGAEVALLTAKYNGGALSDLSVDKITIETDGTNEIAKELADGTKVFLWESLDSMKPVADTFVVGGGTAPTTAPTDAPTAAPTDEPDDYNVYKDQKVDLSKFTDKGGAATGKYDAASDTTSLSGGSKKWAILDLSPYTKYGTEKAMKVNVTYKQIVPSTGRSAFGFYDGDLVKYNTNTWQDIEGSAIVYGVVTGNGKASYYLNGSGTRVDNSPIALDEEIAVDLTFDFAKQTMTGTVGALNVSSDLTNVDSIESFGVYTWSAWTNTCSVSDMKITTWTSTDTYYNVVYSVDGVQTTKPVKAGEKVAPADIPTTDKKGYIFDGWLVDDGTEPITTDALKEMAINANTSFTAKYHIDDNYAQSIAKIEFVDAITSAIKYPEEQGAIENKAYTVKVTSDIGNDITADCTFDWTIVGKSADGYVDLNAEDEANNGATRNLRVRQGGEGCFGYIKAEATYTKNADAAKSAAQIPFAVITDTKAANQVLPAAGYPTSMDDYSDELIGYKGTADVLGTYDIVLDNWCIVGSSPARDLLLVKEDDKKAIEITNVGGTRGGSSSSCLGAMVFPAQSSQYVLETIVKFGGNARLGVWNNTPNNGGAVSEWTVAFDADKITAGGQNISGLTTDDWYKLVVSSDPVNHVYSVYVYDLNGTEKGKIEDVEGGSISAKYLCVDSGFPLYINSLRAYTPSADSVTVNADPETVKVPETDAEPANTVALSAVCATADGIKLTGKVTWALAQEYQGVELEENGAQGATLKVSNGAAGTVTVTASMDGKSASKDITLTNSSDVVSFTAQKSSITIPFTGNDAETATYTAVVLDKNNQTKADTITYSFLDKTGTAPLAALPSGVTSKVEGGSLILTVEAGATPAIFYVRAANDEGLSSKVQVNVHGLSYQFGSEEKEGYTQVTASTLYNDTTGYGFESVTGLTDAADKVSGSAAYKFKAKVPNGNYTVSVDTTSASMNSEIIDAAVAIGANVTGISKSGSSFSVAVCDEVLDLTFAADSSVSTLSIAQIEKPAKREKPAVFAIGDSTTANTDNGGKSWGNCVAGGDVTVPDTFSGFENHGMAGRDSVNYYNQGRVESILLKVRPGDYVTVNMGINSRTENGNEWGAYPTIVDTYYVKAIMERGAIPVIVTATPIGPRDGNWQGNAGKYNTETKKFDVNRGDGARNDELRKLAKKYELNIIELGYAAEDWFNTFDDAYVASFNAANSTSYESVPDMVKNWYVDHNHYKAPIGTWIGNYILNALKEIEADNSTAYSWENDTHISKD